MPYDREKARARKRRYLERKKVEKYGPEALGVDMRGKHGNHARESANGRWAGGRFVASNGYAVIKVPEGGFGSGYRYEHQVVAETALGRELLPNETVHHLNGDKLDNRVVNLEVMTRSDHARIHSAERGRDELGRFRPADEREAA